jgi:hypothetical protein
MNRIRRFCTSLVTLLLVLFFAAGASAQTTLTSTTLTNAITDQTLSITVGSVTGISVGDIVFMEREALLVRAVNTSALGLTVQRGWQGTVSRPHAAASIVYAGAPGRYYSTEVVVGGTCTAAAEAFSPRIVLPTGNVYTCLNSNWRQIGNADGAIYVTCRALLIADQIDQSCFTADRDFILVSLTEVHTTAESAGTLTLIPRRQQGTEAAASGDQLTAAAIDMVGAGAVAQTVKTPALTATAALRLVFAGDRLGLDFTDDTAGELAGVVVTFTLLPR